MSHRDGVQVYTSGISNLVTISAAGLAASTALMQIAGTGASNRYWYLSSLIVFFVGLICCFLAMSGLTGQASLEQPNIRVSNIRLPALISFLLTCAGFILLGVGSFAFNDDKIAESRQTIMKLQHCRAESDQTIEQRIKCYDSFIDSGFSRIEVTNEDLKTLSEKDQSWLKLFILRTKQGER